MTVDFHLPNVEATVWTTTDETTAIRSLSFPDKYVANVNDDSSVSYSWEHAGYDITLTAEKEEKICLPAEYRRGDQATISPDRW